MELQDIGWAGDLSCMGCGGPGGTESENLDAGESNWTSVQGVGGTEAEQDVVGTSGLVGWSHHRSERKAG